MDVTKGSVEQPGIELRLKQLAEVLDADSRVRKYRRQMTSGRSVEQLGWDCRVHLPSLATTSMSELERYISDNALRVRVKCSPPPD